MITAEEKKKTYVAMIKENIEKVIKQKKYKVDNMREDIPNVSITFNISNIWYEVTLKFNPTDTTYDMIQKDTGWRNRRNLGILLCEIPEYIWPQ